MTWRRRLIGSLVLACGLGLLGCAANGNRPVPEKAQIITEERPVQPDPQRSTARLQRADEDAHSVQLVQATVPAQPKPVVSPTPTPGSVRVSVAAWVNDKPIFDEEVKQAAGPRIFNELQQGMPASRQAEVVARVCKEELEQLIERELIYQDAMRKLAQNEKVLDRLKVAAAKEFDKRLNELVRMTRCSSIEEFKRLLVKQGSSIDNLRRTEERNFIAREYTGSIIRGSIDKVGPREILDYYEQHINEFQMVDTVKWQNVFIAIGPKHQTAAEAHRFAEELLARAKKGEEFDRLLSFDDGDSWLYRKGDGYGRRKGEIKPAEAEPYLFQMKDGDVGPLIDLPTGVHIFRLVKREHAGTRPFDDKVQAEIGIKLKNEIWAREYRALVRGLRERSVVEFVPPARP
jgi:peptidyl-prolyl cis-trans isomerase SurA